MMLWALTKAGSARSIDAVIQTFDHVTGVCKEHAGQFFVMIVSNGLT